MKLNNMKVYSDKNININIKIKTSLNHANKVLSALDIVAFSLFELFEVATNLQDMWST